MITHHTELLNALIAKYNLKSYLEIGVQNPANNFNKIKCENKVGVDPEVKGVHGISSVTSDEYFDVIVSGGTAFDLIFIDGLHHADQVKRDFENSLRCLSDNGFIVIHDVLPTEEITTCVPRGNQKIWHGDVYKFAMKMDYDNIGFKTFDIDNGCMLVWKSIGSRQRTNPSLEMNWETYLKHGKGLMNVTSTVEI